ncbi:MAG TPA: hypothetical protein PKH77_03250 [Anaerolineae bacterium]|nr:hypothetical protein [Anaerolineae bacterium]
MKSLVWLSVGLILGLMGGLIYTWVISPPIYYDTYPPMMAEAHRREWIKMTALAYGFDGNWPRAQLRLADLDEVEIQQVVAQTLDAAIAQGRPLLLLQRLADLADSYGVVSPAVTIYLEQPPAPAPTTSFVTPPTVLSPTTVPPAPTATPLPSPTVLPTPTPALPSPYQIISQTLRCASAPQIAVSLVLSHTTEVRGRSQVVQVPQPGRTVWLLWEDGADRAVTGFRPEFGLGYADFIVEPGRIYKVYVDTPTGAPLVTVQTEPCTPDEGGGWIARVLTILERPSLPTTTTLTLISPTPTP